MKKFYWIFLVLFSALLILTGCARGKSGYKLPEIYGVFLVKDRNLVQLNTGEFINIPYKSDLQSVPSTPDKQPILVFNNPDLNLSYLQFFYVDKRKEMEYNAAPQKNGIVEISPVSSLAPGGYCFIQGNPIASFLDGWCFQVEGEDNAGSNQSSGSSNPIAGASTANKSPLPFVIAGTLLVALMGSTALLWRSGRLKAWGNAGFSAGKWNMQALKLSADQGSLQRKLEYETDVLGNLAWKNRVNDPTYSDLFSHLEELDGNKVESETQKNKTQNELTQVQQIRTNKNNDFTSRITELQNRKKAAENGLNSLLTRKNSAVKRIQTAQAELEKTAIETVTLKQRVETNKSSTAADKEQQSTILTNAIAAIEQSREYCKTQIASYQEERSGCELQIPTVEAEVADLGKQISNLSEEQRITITPLDSQIRDLQDTLRKFEREILTIAGQMSLLIKQLGPVVEKTRPETLHLKSQYSQIDKVKGDLNNVIQQNSLLKARLSTNDPKAVRNFILALGLFVVIIIASILLIALNL